MDLQLFKTGLRMFLRPLVMILWPNKGFGKWAKKRGGPLKKKRHNFEFYVYFWDDFCDTEKLSVSQKYI